MAAFTRILPLLLALATTPAAAEPPVPLLWKASNGDTSVYLLGSFHLLKPGDYPLSPDVDAALEDAEAVLFEVPPAEMASPEVAVKMLQAAVRTDGTTLDQEIGPELAARLRAWSDALPEGSPYSAQMLQSFEPWFAGLVISIQQMTQFGLEESLGLDRHFMARAEEAGKPVAGLETVAAQIALFDGMDRVEQVQMLADALEDIESGMDEIMALHGAWRAGDAAFLHERMAAEMRAEFPELYQAINVDRNQAWLPQLVERLETGEGDDTLVVVGALHLLGEDGVVEGLRERGYAVERICSACATDAD